MAVDFNDQVRLGINIGLDELASYETMQPNSMFQLALTLARIAIEPGAESYKVTAAQAMMDLVCAKPNDNVVRLFSDMPKVGVAFSDLRKAS